MGEYEKGQRNQLSRVIVNSGVGSKQLKEFVDNRYGLIQCKQDLPLYIAGALALLRRECESILWTQERNFEVQLGLDETNTLIIGYNVGNRNIGPKSIKLEQLRTTLNQFLQDNNYGNITINKIKIAKSSSVTPGEGKSVHAEQMVILDKLDSMLDDLESGKGLHKSVLNIRGKKFACTSCGRIIYLFDIDHRINQYLTIHTPDMNTYNETRLPDQAVGTIHNNYTAWDNPLKVWEKNIPRDWDAMLSKTKTIEERNFVTALRDFSKVEKLM